MTDEEAQVPQEPGSQQPESPQLELSNLWLVDRSRIQRGRIGCKRERYREYHSGPTGYGIRRKAQSLPLATGSQVHTLLADLLARGNTGPVEEIRALIRKAAGAYQRRCAARGYLEMPDADDVTRAEVLRVVTEQTALVEALGWALHLVWLPALLETWEPVVIEQEFLLTLDEISLLMSRPDAVMRRKVDGALAQIEAKTVGGWLNLPAWRKQWEDSAQLLLTKLAVEATLGEPISFAYIFAMDKGRRSAEDASGLMRQWSFFLYAYHRAANPPMVEEDWQLRWKWVGEDGKNHTLGKGYQREATFLFPFPEKPEEMSAIEYWVRSIPPEEIMSQHEILGPYDFPTHSAQSIVTGVVAEEVTWRSNLWRLHEVGEACAWNEADPRFVEALDRFFPQSWNCHPYGKDCQFLPICRREPLWPAPHEDERFELRRPHHAPEIDQMLERGIEPPEDQDEDEGAEG